MTTKNCVFGKEQVIGAGEVVPFEVVVTVSDQEGRVSHGRHLPAMWGVSCVSTSVGFGNWHVFGLDSSFSTPNHFDSPKNKSPRTCQLCAQRI